MVNPIAGVESALGSIGEAVAKSSEVAAKTALSPDVLISQKERIGSSLFGSIGRLMPKSQDLGVSLAPEQNRLQTLWQDLLNLRQDTTAKLGIQERPKPPEKPLEPGMAAHKTLEGEPSYEMRGVSRSLAEALGYDIENPPAHIDLTATKASDLLPDNVSCLDSLNQTRKQQNFPFPLENDQTFPKSEALNIRVLQRLKDNYPDGKIRTVRNNETGVTTIVIEQSLGKQKLVISGKYLQTEAHKNYGPQGPADNSLDIYALDHFIVQGIDGQCVDLVKRLPKETTLKMTTPTVTKDLQEFDIPGYVHLAAKDVKDESINEIQFYGAHTLEDVAAVWHEAGHSHSFHYKALLERERHMHAILLKREMEEKIYEGAYKNRIPVRDSRAISAEQLAGMDYETAKKLVLQEEAEASRWAVGDMHLLKDVLGFNREDLIKMQQFLKKAYKTYKLPYKAKFFYYLGKLPFLKLKDNIPEPTPVFMPSQIPNPIPNRP